MEEIILHLLKGIGSLHFGDSPQKAIGFFGAPDEEEELTDEFFNEKTLVYHYFAQGFSLFFKNEKTPWLHCAEVDNKEAVLWERKIFALGEGEVKALFKSHGFTVSETELFKGERRISFDEAFTDLYFKNGKLDAINFCVDDSPANIKNLNLN